ncbi:glycosyltransferase, partial [Limnoraphis robusta CCNP1324]|uniref:glycosyltransferase family 2 protein n=1 Tax=Limnoraphis robusta TaxID=1118279 RepID=UPI002B1F27F8
CQNLVESNFMMFRIGHPLLAPAMDAWWAEIERGSRRDQLSFNYALARAGADYFPLTSRPDSVRNHPRLALFHHGSNAESPRPRITPPVRDTASYADVMPARIAAQAHRRADIVVCVHNALDVVILCLESVAQNRDETRHRIVIVDDGSGEETKAWLESFAAAHANVLLVRHEAAGGYTRAANAGLSRMDADFLVLLNSDTIVAGRWVEKMMDAAFSSPGVGIVGPLSSAASHQSIPDHRSTAGQTAVNDMPEGYSVADMNFWCERNAPADFVPRVPLVHGFCYGLTRETVERVGLFDEASFPFGYGEENDYCLRATNAGVGLVVATHTYVYHKKSQSYKDGDRRIGLMRDGNQKIRDLHGAERVIRAVKAMQENPALVRMRKLAEGLFIAKQSRSAP